jgi:8-oxo-dGTP pyrophosphatase MutT (NUDIX family)
MNSLSLEKYLSDENSLKKHIRDILSTRKRRIIPSGNLREAAVLIPLTWNRDEPFMVITKRSMNMEHHKGEFSFPGGSAEPEDKDLVKTALRETQEEIGLDPDDADVLGLLDDHVSFLGYRITPVVGTIPHPYDFQINQESEMLLHVPLRLALSDRTWMADRSVHKDREINIYYLPVNGGVIWGATGRILKHFVDLIAGTRIPFGNVSQEVRAWVEDLLALQLHSAS